MSGEIVLDKVFISDRLAQLRMQKGVSARDMSLSLGQADNYINAIENRKTLPSMTSFFYICDYLGITPQEFFDEGNAHPQKLNELIAATRRLDDSSLALLVDLAKQLSGCRPGT